MLCDIIAFDDPTFYLKFHGDSFRYVFSEIKYMGWDKGIPRARGVEEINNIRIRYMGCRVSSWLFIYWEKTSNLIYFPITHLDAFYTKCVPGTGRLVVWEARRLWKNWRRIPNISISSRIVRWPTTLQVGSRLILPLHCHPGTKYQEDIFKLVFEGKFKNMGFEDAKGILKKDPKHKPLIDKCM